MIAFDTETFLIAPGRLAPRLVCLSWWDGTSGAVLSSSAAVAWFRAQLEDGQALVGHNVAFDVAVMLQADPSLGPLIWHHYDEGLFHDTAVRDRLHHIAKGWYKHARSGKRPKFSLSSLSARYRGTALDGKSDADAWRYRYRELNDVPVARWPAPAVEYALEDARATWEVYDKLPSVVDDANQVRSAWSLHLMSAWGLRTDPERVAALRRELTERAQAARSILQGHGLLRSSGSKDLAAIRSRVIQALGDDAPKTESGKVSTSRDVLESTGDEVLALVATLAADEKILNTYVPVLEAGTERPINPSYWLVESGRTSCTRPNIQNQPRLGGVRECWVPREGMVYVGCDYHIAELCALAQVCVQWFDSSKMRDAINLGQDLHVVTAASILGITYEEAESRRAQGDKAVKQARQLAKAANFGFPGGLGVASFVEFARATYGVEITEKEAKALKRTWLESYPEMSQYFERIAARCGPLGEFTAVQVGSGRKRGGCGFCDGANTYFQGLVADAGRDAVYRVVKATHTPGDPLWGSHAVAFIHDEIILEAPVDRAHEAAMRLSELMVEAMSEWCPDVTIRADAHLMRRWYKDAEPVYFNEKLVPWEVSNA